MEEFNTQDKNNTTVNSASRPLLIGLSVVAGVIGILAVFLFGSIAGQSEPYGFLNGKDIVIEEAVSDFEQTQSNEDLYQLLLGLCYQLNDTSPNPEYIGMIRIYGIEMYDRIKAGTLDLDEMSEDQEQTMAMIDMVNAYGITAGTV